MPRVPTLDEDEYLEIEEAVATTVRGRAFLRMRDHRASLISGNQGRRIVAEIADLLDARESQRSGVGNLELLQRDLKELRDHIERSKGEIAALVGKDGKAISGARLNGATEELYEIVASTERATSEILGAAEWIQERVGALPIADGDRQDFESRCMEIFTACSFQDITGQRIAKVVATMSYVEQRVNTMMSMWDAEGTGGPVTGFHTRMDGGRAHAPGEFAAASSDAEQGLLNGPQLPGLGLGQDAVDALFGKAAAAPREPAAASVVERPPAAARAAPVESKADAASEAPSPAPPAAKPAAKQTKSTPPPAPPAPPAAAAKKAPFAAKLDQSAVDALFN